MSFKRIVPVKLIAGKEYVLRNGRCVYVKDNPHWQCAAKFPFVVMQGADFIVYFTPEGQADPDGGKNEYDIVRPRYKEGEVYLDRDGNRRVINLDDNSPNYPLEDTERGDSWTRDGRILHNTLSPRNHDLMDYERPPAPLAVPPPSPVTDSWVGKRVHFTEDGRSGTGLVLRELPRAPGRFEVRADAPFSGHGTDGLKWHVYAENMRVADANTGITAAPSIMQDALPDLPILATPVTPLRVGMRVEVQLDCDTTVLATIMHEDASHVAIEFDPGFYHVGAWTCAGLVPSGRGWFVPRDSVRVVSEAETQVEAECSESLTEVDVIEIWGAYRINPTIDIESWIAARRKLNAAAK